MELLKDHYQKGLPFVAYRHPNTSAIHVLLQNNSKWHEWNNQEGFVVVDFLWKKPFYFPKEDCQHITFESDFTLFDDVYPDFQEKDTDQKAFEQLVQQAIEDIQLGAFQKVVLSRKIELQENINFTFMVNQLFERFPNAFTYVYFHSNIGCWMGATPEVLLLNENKKYQTVALAGTIYKYENEFINFTDKELIEQKIVADYYREILFDELVQLEVSPAKVVSAANVQHLKSEVVFQVKPSVSTIDILKKIHPTPAVGGTPKETSLQWISKNEGYPREFYAGFLGDFSANQSQLYVQLRCMQWKEQAQTLYVGCGITKDSNPTKEFLETHEKAKAMYQIIKDCN
jgi:isochorismate synthase